MRKKKSKSDSTARKGSKLVQEKSELQRVMKLIESNSLSNRYQPSRVTNTNEKGGCSKTTVTVNLCSSMAQCGHPTVLIDIDPQCNSSAYLGFYDEANNKKGRNIARALKGELTLSDVICETKYENLFIVPGSPELDDLRSDLSGSGIEYDIFSYFLNDPLESYFRLVNFDTHPDLGIYTKAALKCSHYYMIPVTPDLFSSLGLVKQIRETERIRKFQNPMLTFLGVLVNRFKKDKPSHHSFVDVLRGNQSVSRSKIHGLKVLNTVIPDSESVESSISLMTPLNHYRNSKSGPAAAAFMSLVGELLPELKGQRKGRKSLPIDIESVPKGIEVDKSKTIDIGLTI